jgi:adenylate kinase family enzyme
MRHKEGSTPVEFIGLPASGKSTISREIAEKLDREKYHHTNRVNDVVHNRNRLLTMVIMLIYSLITYLRHPIRSTKLLAIIHQTRQPSINRTLKLWLYHMFLIHVYFKLRDEPGVHIFDQGVVQSLWSVALTGSKTPRSTLVRILELYEEPSCNIVVTVDVDVQESISRLESRKTNISYAENLAKDNGVDIRQRYRSASNAMKEVVDYISHDTNISFLTVSTSNRSVEYCANRVTNGILQEVECVE